VLGDAATQRLLAAEPAHELATLGEVLLTPTRIYARDVLAIREALVAAGHDVRSIAHITGGGLPGNLPRVLPENTVAVLEPFWSVPSVFRWLARTGGVAPAEMLRAFNCGIGMAVVVADPDAAMELLRDHGESVSRIGHIAAGIGPAALQIDLPPGWPG